MAKKLIKENQRYHHLDGYLLLGLFTTILLFDLLKSVVTEGTKDLSHWGIFSLLMLLFALAWWVVLKARLKIKVTKSALKIKRTPLLGITHKLPFAAMEKVSFFKLSQAARTSGWVINPRANCKQFGFGDDHGLYILMKNGEEYIVFSDLLYQRRHQLEKIMEQQED